MVIQMSNEPVHAIFATEHGDVFLPLASVADEIGNKATLIRQKTLNIGVDELGGRNRLPCRFALRVSLLKGWWLEGWLDGALVGGNGHVKMTTVALLPATAMRVFSVHTVHGSAR